MESNLIHGSAPVEVLYESDRILAATTWRGMCDVDNPYSGFSVCHYVGDDEAHWHACRNALARYFGVDTAHVVVPRQTHGSNVSVVSSAPVEPSAIENVDAVITNLPGVVVGVNTADCLPLLLFDEMNGVVGTAHAGWRGAVGGIIGNTLTEMIKNGASVEALHAIIAPHIGVCCFEVGEEVAGQFHPDDVVRADNVRPHVDLSRAVVRQLIDAGVSHENIVIHADCKRCNPDRYFSARAHGIASGRNFTFIMLKK